MRVEGAVPRFHMIGKSEPDIMSQPIFAVSPDKMRILVEKTPDPTVVLVTDFVSGLDKK